MSLLVVHLNTLRNDNDLPHMDAEVFWSMLRSGWDYGLYLFSEDAAQASHWARRHHFAAADAYMEGDLGRSLTTLSTQGVSFYFDADPENVAVALRLGIPSLTLVHPRWARPEWRPDDPAGVTGWNRVLAERS